MLVVVRLCLNCGLRLATGMIPFSDQYRRSMTSLNPKGAYRHWIGDNWIGDKDSVLTTDSTAGGY
jgi:hypothetical protein